MKKLYLFAVLVGLVGCSSSFSYGYRIGTIRKFSRKGVFVKSWEGEMLLGGVVSTGGKTPQLINETFDFSLDPDARHGEKLEEVIKQINNAAEKGSRVKLYYNQDTIPKIRSDSNYFIYKCEELREKEPRP